MKTNHQKITSYVIVQYQKDEEEELIKYTYANNRYSFSYTWNKFFFEKKKRKRKFEVSQKSNCLYDYVLEYRADLTFSIYTAGD
jgi:hypothetical protein